MIRIRSEDGTLRELAATDFIEIVNPQTGKVVQVIHWAPRIQAVREIVKGDSRYEAYQRMFPDTEFEQAK